MYLSINHKYFVSLFAFNDRCQMAALLNSTSKQIVVIANYHVSSDFI